MNTSTKLALAVAVIAIVAIAAFAASTLIAPKATTTSSSSGSTSSISLCCSTNLVRIGYFANINHAQALIGLFNGDYQRALGSSVQIQSTLFTAGPTEMTALLAGKLDMAYVGPSPALNAYIQSNGTGVKIIAGASSGGALFVVTDASGIKNASQGNVQAQLAHKSFLGPQLGNTQDVALRAYLLANHLVAGTNVTVGDTSNANIVTEMVGNKTDGAWVPQPYAALILTKAKAHVFLDERSLWPGGSFSTAELVVSTPFLTAHPDIVSRIVMAHVNETVWINKHISQASAVMNETILSKTGIGLTPSELNGSLNTLSFTYDPLAASVQKQALNAYNLGFLGKTAPNLTGLYDLTILNGILVQLGLPAVSS
jgi:NitT/TauT family transport system substrate-binding protein